MEQWTRFFYQPSLPIGRDGKRVTGSKEHIALSREAAAEGMVLVKNEQNVLPLGKGARVALFGKGSVDYVKGGGGSGDVTVAYIRNLLDGMRCKEEEGKVRLYPALGRFYEEEVKKQYDQGIAPGLTKEPDLPEELLTGARAFTDTAIISICRFSGENWDRTIQSEDGSETKVSEFQSDDKWLIDRSNEVFEHGDFYLSKAEACLVSRVKAVFDRVIVVMNVGGMVDTSWFKEDEEIQSVLMSWQGGMEGGLATADVLCGDVNPSGKLVDTFAKRLEDYPSSYNYHDSLEYAEYTEDIYVGYRYFETIPGKAERVNYPFGYGLSYTKFMVETRMVGETAGGMDVLAAVTNVGSRAGKEVLQLYVEAPQGKLGKPARELKAFAKTRLLAPGETQTVRLGVRFDSLASYDDLGKIRKSCYVLEQGAYQFYLGTSVRDTMKLDYVYQVKEDVIVSELSSQCAPTLLKERMLADGSMEALEQHPEKVRISRWPGVRKAGAFNPSVKAREGGYCFGDPEGKEEKKIMFCEVLEGTVSLDQFMDQLSIEDLIDLLCGQPNTGVANTFGFGNLPDYGVPNVMTADGPAGLRIRPVCGVNTTAFPCATLLACSWNPELVARVGEAGAAEVLENNIGVWLTPAMNIHRSPLCGRNFEYYSEDPLIAGKMGAAKVRGIQSQGVAASVKHFACNNKETCRFESDSRVSERALREIYLKGFEIVVKEADPWTIMSSYNIINGERASENKGLLTGILRGEWGFKGMVTTDWWNHASQSFEIKAGNDVKMGCGYPEEVRAAYEAGTLSEKEIRTCARRVLELILKTGDCR